MSFDPATKPYGLVLGRGSAVVPVGLHTKTNAQGLTNGTDTSTSYRTFHPLIDSTVGSVLPVFDNWYGSGDTNTGNAITVAAAVEASDGTILPFTFNGAHTVSIPQGGLAIPDNPIGFGVQTQLNDLQGDALARKGVWIRSYVSVTSGQRWPISIDPRLVSGEGNNGGTGADLTLSGSGSVTGGGFSYAYGPAVLLGRVATRKPIVAVIGDSQVEGSNDYCVTRGYVERSLSTVGYPMVKLAKGGEAAFNFVAISGRKYRMSFLDGCTHAIVNYGTNDLVNRGRTTTQLQNDLLGIWTYLAGLGIKVYQTTITPRTTSTNTWTTSGGQTASGSGGTTLTADLATVNAYIRAAVGGGVLTGVIEVGDAVSTARDSGLWASNTGTSGSGLTVTDDGTHPSALCIVNTLAPLVASAISGWTVG